jgi:hypothetical protein
VALSAQGHAEFGQPGALVDVVEEPVDVVNAVAGAAAALALVTVACEYLLADLAPSV